MDKNKVYTISAAIVVGSGVAVLLIQRDIRNKERARRREKLMECLIALKELTDTSIDVKKRAEAAKFWTQVIKG